ncbi:MAG: hypothetical protein D6801_02915 [Alphaproteobacteria bacterium]|nr:MAG: hypothetical protein D6801_02915 [Alphaproteobacteria bacterium]
MHRALLSLFLLLLALPAQADEAAAWRFGGDTFAAGESVRLGQSIEGDVFAAGNRVSVRGDVGGTAHLAGRRVMLEGRVGQNLYGAGSSVTVAGPVAGNATLAGQTVTVTEPVAGNLRATGSDVEILAPVAGAAILAGETVAIDGVISGDVALAAKSVDWGDKARIEGTLHLYADDPQDIEVPAAVAPEARVIRHPASEFEHDTEAGRKGVFQRLGGWLGGVVFIGVLGTIFAAVAPGTLGRLRERALSRPVRAGLLGFAALSALVGSVVLLAMTGIGLLLVPVSLVAAVLLGLVGYVVGVYALGVWAIRMTGRGLPESTGGRAVAAFAGAALGALVALVPWLGWLAVMAIFLAGAGALVWPLAARWAGRMYLA